MRLTYLLAPIAALGLAFLISGGHATRPAQASTAASIDTRALTLAAHLTDAASYDAH